MATEPVPLLPPHASAPLEAVEDKVNEEHLEPTEKEVVLSSEKMGEKKDSSKVINSTSSSIESSQSGEAEKKQIEPPTPELQMTDDVPEAISDAVESQPEEQQATESAGEEVETSMEKVQGEHPDMDHVAEPSVELKEKLPEAFTVEKSQMVVVRDNDDPQVSSGSEVHKQPVVPELLVEEKSEQQSRVNEKLETVSEEIEKPETVPLEMEIKSEDRPGVIEDVETMSKEIEKPEPVAIEVGVKPERQSVVNERDEIDKPGAVADVAEVKSYEQSGVTQQFGTTLRETENPEQEPKLEEESGVNEQAQSKSKDVEKPEHVAIGLGRKLEEESEVNEQAEIMSKEAEKPQPVATEVEVKCEEQSEVDKYVETSSKDMEEEVTAAPVIEVIREVQQSRIGKQLENMSNEVENPAVVVSEIKVKPEVTPEDSEEADSKDEKFEPKESMESETGKDEGSLAVKTSLLEEKSGNEGEPNGITRSQLMISAGQEAQADLKHGAVASLLDSKETVATNEEKNELHGVDLLEKLPKEVVAEKGKVGKENEAGSTKVEGNNEEENLITERLVESIKLEDVKDETPDSAGTNRGIYIQGKLNEVNELVQASQKSGSEESMKSGEENLEGGKTEETDVQKDGEDGKSALDMPKEAPAKATQKQPNNIISKVKQSLVKAKKAITGKSPSKGDNKVK